MTSFDVNSTLKRLFLPPESDGTGVRWTSLWSVRLTILATSGSQIQGTR